MKLLRAFAAAALAIFVAVPALAQGTGLTGFQFPNIPWQSWAPGEVQCGWLSGANFNSTADQKITLMVPTAAYTIDTIVITAPSTSMTTAQGGVYSAASKGGVAIVASSQAYSALTTNTANTTGNTLLLTLSTAGNTTEFTAAATPALYLSLTTGQGATATANVRIYCRPMYPVN